MKQLLNLGIISCIFINVYCQANLGHQSGHRPHVDISGIHIDPPGIHGNQLNEDALHLPPGATVQDAINAGVIPDPSLPATEPQTRHGTHSALASGSNVHVDLPGQHDNPFDGAPVIPRDSIPHAGEPLGRPFRNVHVDLPGEHGNPIGSPAVVHKEHPINHGPHVESSVGSAINDVHIDLPGEHGNPITGPAVVHRDTLDFPAAVHNEHPAHHGSHVDTHVGSAVSDVHIDLPGEHGNPITGPAVVHRDTVAPQINHGTPIGNVHIDIPGEHGNPIDSLPVVHREEHHHAGHPAPFDSNSGVLIGNVHVDMPGEHGNPIDGVPVIHRENAGVLHGPESFTSGSGSFPIDTTGSSLGDLLGIGSVPLSESVGGSQLEPTNLGVMGKNSVLLTNSWRRPEQMKRKCRRGPRGRRCRRRNRKTTTSTTSTTTATTTTTTTTTTPAPKTGGGGGGGITVIRTSRPNPFSALVNNLRSGLLGSLFQSGGGFQQGPVRIQPFGGPIRIQPAGGLFGRLFGGKR